MKYGGENPMCSIKFEGGNEMFNEIWMRMNRSIKYECENKMFNEIWEWELNVQYNLGERIKFVQWN